MNTNIFNIQHFSVHDGPGIRTVIFFKGCPLDCVWCHNPESKAFKPELSFDGKKCTLCAECSKACAYGVHSIDKNKLTHEIDRNRCIGCNKCVNSCPASALTLFGRPYTHEQLLEELEKDDVFFGTDGGVTFSGGEPFAQFDSLISLLKICKSKGYSTCIETSGYTKAEHVKEAALYTDVFLYDCKETDSIKHKKYTGVGNEAILRNLYVLDDAGATVILRCPIIKGINDIGAHYEGIAALANAHSCIKSIEIMPYHPLGIAKSERIGKASAFNDTEFLDSDTIEACQKAIALHTNKPVLVSK